MYNDYREYSIISDASVIFRTYGLTILPDFDKEGEYYGYCKALGFEEKNNSWNDLEKSFIEFVKERVDESGKKK
jgi:hypothetical protein